MYTGAGKEWYPGKGFLLRKWQDGLEASEFFQSELPLDDELKENRMVAEPVKDQQEQPVVTSDVKSDDHETLGFCTVGFFSHKFMRGLDAF